MFRGIFLHLFYYLIAIVNITFTSVNSFSETTRLFFFQTNHFLNDLCKELHLDFDWRPQVNALQFYYCEFGWSLDPLRGISPHRELCTPLKSRQNRSLYHPITDPASLTLTMKTYLPSVPLWAAGWRMKTKLSGYVTWEFSIFKKNNFPCSVIKRWHMRPCANQNLPTVDYSCGAVCFCDRRQSNLIGWHPHSLDEADCSLNKQWLT